MISRDSTPAMVKGAKRWAEELVVPVPPGGVDFSTPDTVGAVIFFNSLPFAISISVVTEVSSKTLCKTLSSLAESANNIFSAAVSPASSLAATSVLICVILFLSTSALAVSLFASSFAVTRAAWSATFTRECISWPVIFWSADANWRMRVASFVHAPLTRYVDVDGLWMHL